jgi:hypothetical protein
LADTNRKQSYKPRALKRLGDKWLTCQSSAGMKNCSS